MNKKRFSHWTLAALFAALAGSSWGQSPTPIVYRIINLGNPLGGTVSQGTTINSRDWIAGFSALPGDTVMQAVLWRHGQVTPLGTLGGPNSAVAWPNRNDHGLVVGIAEENRPDPLHEDWSCGLAVFFTITGDICRGFVWQDGRMTALPTLGGYDGFATGVNNRGQIVGWAEDRVQDPTCNANNQVLQFEAVLWTGRGSHYQAHELPPAPGDLDGAATAINQRGEVVGISGLCGGAIGGETAEHMVVWSRGHVVRILPTLGGSYWNTPMDINDTGSVVGFSDLPGDGPTFAGANFQAFDWSARPFRCNGQMTSGTCDLGVLPGNQYSEALGINDRGQVVGLSFGGTAPEEAFLWQDGEMTNLNSLAQPGTTLDLVDAQDINNRGIITGQAIDSVTGATVAFEAIPVRPTPQH
jgi:probable HAF family extracellular repeat protein